jgi:hypothetical protein
MCAAGTARDGFALVKNFYGRGREAENCPAPLRCARNRMPFYLIYLANSLLAADWKSIELRCQSRGPIAILEAAGRGLSVPSALMASIVTLALVPQLPWFAGMV